VQTGLILYISTTCLEMGEAAHDRVFRVRDA